MSSQADIVVSANADLSDSDIQDNLAKAIRLYAKRVAERDDACPLFRPTPSPLLTSW
jgi:hypothetical protein